MQTIQQVWITKEELRNDPAWNKLRSLKALDTINTYEDWLPHFLEHSKIKYPSDALKLDSRILFDNISNYVRSLVIRNLSASTINVNISTLKFFLKGNGMKNLIDWDGIEMYTVNQNQVKNEEETIIQAYEKCQLEKILNWAKQKGKFRLMVETIFPSTSGIRAGVLGGQDAIQLKDMSLFIKCAYCHSWLEEKKWLQFWQLIPAKADDRITNFEAHMIEKHAKEGAQFIRQMKQKDFERFIDMLLFMLNPYSDDKSWRYNTFVTPQATDIGKQYLLKRQARGEELGPESYLIVDDRNNSGKPISRNRVEKDIRNALLATGIRREKHDHERTDLQVVHSTRAFFDTTVSATPTSPLIKERLLGHSIVTVDGVKLVHSKSYFKPTPLELLLGKDQLKGYIEAIPALTLNIK